MNNIKLTNPLLFLLLIPLFAVTIWGFIKIARERRNAKNIVSFIIHLAICALLTLSLVDLNYLNAAKNTELYILADVSESTHQTYDKIDQNIKELSQKVDDKTKIGIVCFAKNYQLLTPIGGEIKSVKSANVDTSATDLEGALNYVSNLYHDNVIKKLFLISDGIETDNHAINSIEQLRNLDINIDALYLNNPIIENEVQINGVEYTKNTYLDRTETLKVAIQTGTTSNVTLNLYKNNEKIDSKNATLNKGIDIVNFALDTSIVGTHMYKVEVEANNDINSQNNVKYFTQKITENFKVLIIGNRSTDCYSAGALYNDNCILDYYFNNDPVPYKIEDLVKYDEIVLANANVVSFNNHEEFVQNLEIVVSKYGKSLITYGATYASGTSSQTMSKYNNMLPVQFESSDKKCVALVIDASSSMQTDQRLDKAIDGAIACLDLLGEKDSVTVISFGEDTRVLQPLTSAKDREKIIENIRSITVSYATNMTKGLDTAYNQIRNNNSENKHVILLSDGLPTESNYEESLRSVVTKMSNNKIVTSFINICCREGENLMKSLSQIGNGSYYFINRASDIVDVILTSVADVVTETKIEGDFEVHLNRKNDLLVKNVGDLPHINGYNFARIKGSANTVYTVTYTNELGGTRDVPLLAYWTFGKGKVVSFTSDISTTWAVNFKNSTGGEVLFKNIVDYLEPKERIDTLFEVNTSNNGFSTDIKIALDFLNKDAYLEVNVFTPNNKQITKYLKNENTAYQLTILTEEIGLYRLELTYHNGDYVYSNAEYFDFSYSKEYDYFLNGNEQLLSLIVGENGKVSEVLDYSLISEETNIRYYETITPYLLLASIVLFIIDIIIRKLRLSDLKITKRKEI
ncbi:MAG: VWA domain-containing protein [Erysipelotrichales bacterium]|nr:VWA domain-containing protein [Erysipelotrichales bacterium]